MKLKKHKKIKSHQSGPELSSKFSIIDYNNNVPTWSDEYGVMFHVES